MDEKFRMDGKVAIVTGGHAWLGYDMACALAEEGCSMIITSRDRQRAEETAKRIGEQYQVDTLGLKLEQTDYESVSAMAEQAFAWKKRIDVLINNAGGGSGASEGDFMKRSPEDMVNLITTNLIGSMFCCQQVGRYMIGQQSGSIINMGSIAGIVGRDRDMYRTTGLMEQPIDYSAAKGGVIAMTRDLACYMSPYHVRVNSISPGGFDKGNLPAAFTKAYGETTPVGRMGKMGEEIKGAALFLASDASAYVTGHNLVVDGGFSIMK
jgi:gluconate 5-dehydrogenase